MPREWEWTQKMSNCSFSGSLPFGLVMTTHFIIFHASGYYLFSPLSSSSLTADMFLSSGPSSSSSSSVMKRLLQLLSPLKINANSYAIAVPPYRLFGMCSHALQLCQCRCKQADYTSRQAVRGRRGGRLSSLVTHWHSVSWESAHDPLH